MRVSLPAWTALSAMSMHEFFGGRLILDGVIAGFERIAFDGSRLWNDAHVADRDAHVTLWVDSTLSIPLEDRSRFLPVSGSDGRWQTASPYWTCRFDPADLRFEFSASRSEVFEMPPSVSDILYLVALAMVSSLESLALHASVVSIGDRAIAFVGRSGVGKTTAACHFPFEQRLADDRAIFVASPGGWTAIASPFRNRDEVSLRGPSAPLAAVVVLEQRGLTQMRRLRPAEAFASLMTQLVPARLPWRPGNPLDPLGRFVETIPVFELSYRLGDDLQTLLGRVIA